jgi:hypothetical protein
MGDFSPSFRARRALRAEKRDNVTPPLYVPAVRRFAKYRLSLRIYYDITGYYGDSAFNCLQLAR